MPMTSLKRVSTVADEDDSGKDRGKRIRRRKRRREKEKRINKE